MGVSVLAFSSDSRYLATRNGKSLELHYISFTSDFSAPALLALPLCLSLCRQHGHCAVGLGPAEDEPAGGAGADVSCALLSVGPQTAPFGAVHRKRQAVPVVPGGMCLCSSPS